jgi:acyl carrier protein
MSDGTCMIESVAAIWRELLGRPDVDADSNFFMLGGDSLAATVLMVHLEEKFGVMLDPTEVFETPILETFATKVAQLVSDSASADGAEVGVL